MIRKLQVLLVSMFIAVVPLGANLASAQGANSSVNVVCTREVVSEYGPIYAYSVDVTITNTSGEDIRGSIFAIQETGGVDRRILSNSIGAGETATIEARGANNAESYGWQVRLYYDNGPYFDIEEYENDVFFTQNYMGGECGGESGTLPTMTPPTPTPTQTLVPTATLAPEQTPTPVPNSFTLVSAQRMCADQSFVATWTGSNLDALEFSLTNTSDEWTTGWVNADPAAGTFNLAVDHHNYDKVAAHATFTDGTDATDYMDIGACTKAPVPPPPPAVVDPPAAAPVVSSLPSTGSGDDGRSMLVFGAVALLASSSIALSTLRKRI